MYSGFVWGTRYGKHVCKSGVNNRPFQSTHHIHFFFEMGRRAKKASKPADEAKLCFCHKGDRTYYGKFNKFSTFSVEELVTSLNIDAKDVSFDLNPAVDMRESFSRFSQHIEEIPPTYYIYMRDSINRENFVALQHCIEKTFLNNHMADLQGWIMHCGASFIIGGVEFDLEETVSRIKEAMSHVRRTE